MEFQLKFYEYEIQLSKVQLNIQISEIQMKFNWKFEEIALHFYDLLLKMVYSFNTFFSTVTLAFYYYTEPFEYYDCSHIALIDSYVFLEYFKPSLIMWTLFVIGLFDPMNLQIY